MTGSAADRLAIVVHEVRSPVAALSTIERALAGNGFDGAERRALVVLVLRSCRAIERIVADASVASVRREPVEVAQLLEDVSTTAAMRGALVRVDVPTALPAMNLDPVRIRQALENLLANALAHSPPGEEVVLRAATTGDDVLFSVVDRGPGIPADELERIFQPGERLAASHPGSGLGLAVSRAIAEEHGGRLSVDSAPGKGATFTLVLPLRG